MYYWDGSAWVLIPIGTHGQNLTVCNGVPTWGPCPILVPTLTTNTITSVTSSTAIGGGNITNDGGALVTARGVCYSTSINPTTANNFTVNGSNIGGFTSSMSGLAANTTYYVRAYATNSAGTAYGNQVSFTTNPIFLPTLTTTGITAVGNSSANSGGNISNDGGSPITARGVCYSTSSNPTIANGITIDGSGIGTYISAINGLLPNTTYYVRAYATNILGTAYGNQVIFTTQALAIGQNYLGGVIAYIDGSGLHGLIAAPSDQSNGIFWHASASGITGATATAIGTGNANTNTIVASYGTENNAALLCNNLILNGYSDWYLPSKDEMTYLFTNSNAIGGFTTNFYWTSSEVNAGLAISFDFFNGNNGNYNKTNINYVRAVRTF